MPNEKTWKSFKKHMSHVLKFMRLGDIWAPARGSFRTPWRPPECFFSCASPSSGCLVAERVLWVFHSQHLCARPNIFLCICAMFLFFFLDYVLKVWRFLKEKTRHHLWSTSFTENSSNTSWQVIVPRHKPWSLHVNSCWLLVSTCPFSLAGTSPNENKPDSSFLSFWLHTCVKPAKEERRSTHSSWTTYNRPLYWLNTLII